ncbi:MBL fold metallo-hydrolase [Paraglaciecola polaris]|uniref:MBL fold metallo-hydrolase n=1 Tax=Paraglaciecola polaris TaxID=222814 RepID=UPI00058F9616|nr:MBL fold metallo-hydrolase [Paraglaciecola polaris]
MKTFVLSILFICVSSIIGAYLLNNELRARSAKSLPNTAHFADGKFHNDVQSEAPTLGKTLGIFARYFTEKKTDATPTEPMPMHSVTRAQLDALSEHEIHIVKLGHSSLLLKMYDEYWLIDPVFSQRASPFSFLGPKRFEPTPISIDALPPIDKVLISHNHYDHLDRAAIKTLNAKTKAFYVPLGVEADLQKWGIHADKIQRFDWWQELQTQHALVVFTPTQHFSGRAITDGNKTLWGSWVIKTATDSVYFSGDSGYFSGFEAIGDKYGPFDITLIENGAYDKDWADIHMTPEESVQAHVDLRGKIMVPIHNGTFDLAFHPWYEPLVRVKEAASKHNVTLSTPVFGQIFSSKQQSIQEQWWPK